MGVWIETSSRSLSLLLLLSHPVWVCGLKQVGKVLLDYPPEVTPCMGVWIETLLRSMQHCSRGVTPCMGVWIETSSDCWRQRHLAVTPCMGVWIETNINGSNSSNVSSHPVWVCGLKRGVYRYNVTPRSVTPCMGVWIETLVPSTA